MANTTNTMRGRNEEKPAGLSYGEEQGVPQAEATVGNVANQAREAAANVAEKVKEAATSAAHRAGDMASNVGHKAEQATSAVGGSMRSLAGTIRENAPQGGMIGSMSSNVAGSLESGGRYLQEHGLRGIGEELTNLIRRNPLPAVLLGIGLGFLIARATQRDGAR